MRALVWAALLAGCYQSRGLVPCDIACKTVCPGDLACGADGRCHEVNTPLCSTIVDPTADAAPPPHGDGPPPANCYGTNRRLEVCVPDVIPQQRALSTMFDTDTGDCILATTRPLMDACIVAAHQLVVSTVRVTGTRPLVLVGDQIDVMGYLDVQAAPGRCSTNGGASMGQVGAGGAGGSYHGVGGTGGDGNDAEVAGGVAAPPSPIPSVLVGGCPGGVGGMGTDVGGYGGAGGGALALIGGDVTVDSGAISVSGHGGGGGYRVSGGGGGGAGGMILVEGNALRLLGPIDANGGGGGGGTCGAYMASPGMDGGASVAVGGSSGGDVSTNGKGGNGSFTSIDGDSGMSGSSACGGGGGGGGGGWIIVDTAGVPVLGSSIHPGVTRP